LVGVLPWLWAGAQGANTKSNFQDFCAIAQIFNLLALGSCGSSLLPGDQVLGWRAEAAARLLGV
jgi:hypothetical protein